jgi:hypothetical protein
VRAPLVALLLQTDAYDPRCAKGLGLVLHPGHGQLPGFVQRLGEVGELGVLADRPERLAEAPVGDVVDAGPHDQALGDMPGLHDGPEVLAGEVRGEGLPELVAVGLPVFRLDRGPDGDELGGVGAPLVVVDVEADTDDTIGPEGGGLFLHAVHGQLTGVVHRCGELVQLLGLPPLPGLQTDVVDRRAHHEPDGVEADLFDQEELVDRQVRGEQAPLELGQTFARRLGQIRRDIRIGHAGPPMMMFSSARRAVWLWPASARRDSSRRRSHSSMATRSERIRMPPEEWATVQVTFPLTTSAR